MTTDTLHERAADELEDVAVKIHRLNGKDVRELLELADELRDYEEQSGKNKRGRIPKIGDVMHDTESEFGNDLVTVEEVTESEADEVFIHDLGKTVAKVNPRYPNDDRVIKASYVDGNDEIYSFPVSRLRFPPSQ